LKPAHGLLGLVEDNGMVGVVDAADGPVRVVCAKAKLQTKSKAQATRKIRGMFARFPKRCTGMLANVRCCRQDLDPLGLMAASSCLAGSLSESARFRSIAIRATALSYPADDNTAKHDSITSFLLSAAERIARVSAIMVHGLASLDRHHRRVARVPRFKCLQPIQRHLDDQHRGRRGQRRKDVLAPTALCRLIG
jgi:hypothetical protein